MLNFPIETHNKNVPPHSFLLCQYSQMSGEIITTYADYNGQVWQVGDWVNDRPHKVNIAMIAHDMGLNPIYLYRAIVKYIDKLEAQNV